MASSLYKWLGICFFALMGRPDGKNDRVPHPMYITVTEIDHNAKDQALEISCKIFTNDFEDALEKVYRIKTDLSAPKDKSAADRLVSDYISRHLQIRADGRPLALEFVGFEKETDATWSYFQAGHIAAVHSIEVTNTLLYETFEGQIGIMHVTVGGNRQSEKISNPTSSASFTF